MGLSEGMAKITQQVQDGVRFTLASLIAWMVKLVSALFLAFTLAIVAQEVMQFHMLAFLFVMVLTTGLLLKLMQKWSVLNVIAFDLVCVLVGLGLKMYILLAP